MVTLSLTRSRIAAVLDRAAGGFEAEPWDPYLNPLLEALDAATGCVPGCTGAQAEDVTIAAWEALEAHLGYWPGDWERVGGRTQAEVEAVLREVAAKVVAP